MVKQIETISKYELMSAIENIKYSIDTSLKSPSMPNYQYRNEYDMKNMTGTYSPMEKELHAIIDYKINMALSVFVEKLRSHISTMPVHVNQIQECCALCKDF